MADHTPGPWMVENRELGFDGGDGRPGSHGSQTHLIWSDNDHDDTNVIAHIVVDGEIDKAEADANARLIVLAPQFLRILVDLVEQVEAYDLLHGQNTCAIDPDAARAAIAKMGFAQTIMDLEG